MFNLQLQFAPEKQGRCVRIVPGGGVNYVVPQFVRPGKLVENVELCLRVDQIYSDADLVIKADGQTLKRFKKKRLTPGVMEKLAVDKSLIEKYGFKVLTIEVERGM